MSILRCCTAGMVLAVPLLSWAQTQEGGTYAALMEKHGLSPGLQITKANADLIKNAVPDVVYKRTKAGDYTFIIGKLEPPDILTKIWPQYYYQETERHIGKYDVDAEGGIIEKTTGERPWPMPYGLPFPKIDLAEDPKKVGAKIHWNAFSLLGMQQDIEASSRIGSFPPRGKYDRYAATHVIRQYIDFRREPIQINRPIMYQENSMFSQPTDAFGSVTLTWRWTDPTKWDSVWNYSPSVRRVQRLTAANRSDPILGTEATRDDSGMYNGKPEMMEWKYIGQGVTLMPYIRPQAQSLDDMMVRLPLTGDPSLHYPRAPKAFQLPLKRGTLAYSQDPQQYVSWWQPDFLWVIVPAYLVEAVPKDPYYNYGRQIFWFEQTTFMPVWKEIYDRSGEYWKTAWVPFSFTRFNANGEEIMIYDPPLLTVVDEKANRGTFTPRGSTKLEGDPFFAVEEIPDSVNIGLDPDMWSLGRFLEYGK